MVSISAATRAAGAVAALAVLAACEEPAIPQGMRIADGEAAAGAVLIRDFGCGACHAIPGITGARGIVGPPLDAFALRTYVAGIHPNTPENLVSWLIDPPAMAPETAMPDMGVTEQEARHMAAYLYSLR